MGGGEGIKGSRVMSALIVDAIVDGSILSSSEIITCALRMVALDDDELGQRIRRRDGCTSGRSYLAGFCDPLGGVQYMYPSESCGEHLRP